MSIADPATALRFLFDHHISGPALIQLRAKRYDILSVADVELAEADDAEILAWARDTGRIVITRNYRDFAPLVVAYTERSERFPGVLFVSSSIRASDVGAHVRAFERWVEAVQAAGRNPAENGWDWLQWIA